MGYLRYKEWDTEAQIDRHRREYVPNTFRNGSWQGCGAGYADIVLTLPFVEVSWAYCAAM